MFDAVCCTGGGGADVSRALFYCCALSASVVWLEASHLGVGCILATAFGRPWALEQLPLGAIVQTRASMGLFELEAYSYVCLFMIYVFVYYLTYRSAGN